MALHMYGDQHMLSSHTDSVPLEEPLQNFLSQGRIVSVGHDVIHDGDKTMWGHSLSSIGFNYATLWGLYHFGGNDALLPLKNFDATLGCNWRSDFNLPPATTLKFDEDVPLEYFRAWGVRWYVVDSSITIDNFDNIQLSLMDRYRKILYDSLARPLVYWGDTVRNNGIESTFTTNSVIIRTNRNENAQLVLALLHNPSFAVYIDGKPASYQESTQQQITLDVPLGSHSIRISYVDKSFIIGLYISIATILSLFTYLFIYIHRVRMIDKKTSKQ
jgi:hypothetical protein